MTGNRLLARADNIPKRTTIQEESGAL